jgi:hypothetical protein
LKETIHLLDHYNRARGIANTLSTYVFGTMRTFSRFDKTNATKVGTMGARFGTLARSFNIQR